jgi:ribonuclease J
LDRISRHELPIHLSQDDQIIFSSRTIPSPINEVNREQLEKRLRKFKVRIFDNVHVSGHGGREDLRELIKLTNPEHVIPSHGDLKKLSAGVELAEEMGYKPGKSVHLTSDGKMLQF